MFVLCTCIKCEIFIINGRFDLFFLFLFLSLVLLIHWFIKRNLLFIIKIIIKYYQLSSFCTLILLDIVREIILLIKYQSMFWLFLCFLRFNQLYFVLINTCSYIQLLLANWKMLHSISYVLTRKINSDAERLDEADATSQVNVEFWSCK